MASLLKDPSPEWNDQTRLLGERDEVGRRQHPTLGVHPTYECLDADDLVPIELDDGLVMEDELLFLDPSLELALAIDLGQQFGSQPGPEHLAAPFAAALGCVHRHVGIAEQRFRRLGAVHPEGHADGTRHADRVTGHLDRFGQGLDDAGRYLDRVVRLGHLLEEDCELVSPESGDGVGSPNCRSADAPQ